MFYRLCFQFFVAKNKEMKKFELLQLIILLKALIGQLGSHLGPTWVITVFIGCLT